jgi:hypothetical protein
MVSVTMTLAFFVVATLDIIEQHLYLRLEVPTVVLRVMMPCGLAGAYQRSGEMCNYGQNTCCMSDLHMTYNG